MKTFPFSFGESHQNFRHVSRKFAPVLMDAGVASISRAVRGVGYAWFSSSPARPTKDIAEQVGELADLPGIPLVQQLRPSPSDGKEKSSLTGIYGTAAFPLHTDMAHWAVPPRYFMLRCVRGGANVFTNLLHWRSVFSDKETSALKRALFRPRRRIESRLISLPLHDGSCFRWDPIFIQPINKVARELQVGDRLEACGSRSILLDANNDCLLVDNWSVLHGRSSVAETNMNRLIERVYLSALFS
jgi:L-asparagine oxygenase